jgi:hypothetical protein
MLYDLKTGKQMDSHFIHGAEQIACGLKYYSVNSISDDLNKMFFDGGPSQIRQFGKLFSISHVSSQARLQKVPHVKQIPGTTQWIPDGSFHHTVKIEKKASLSAFLGVIEGIPLIGKVVAVLTSLGHLIGMGASYICLKRAASRLLNAPKDKEIVLKRAASVFKHAMDYTIHRNYLTGSLLSLIFLAKPIKRLLQLRASSAHETRAKQAV